MVGCDTGNHDATSVTPPNTEATCYEWCCEVDAYHCEGTCIPDIDGSPINGEITETPNDDGVTRECCIENDCCGDPINSPWNSETFP